MVGIRIRAAVVTGLLACAMLISPTSQGTAEAVFPGANGRIAFELNTFGQGADVWTVNPDGTGLRQVTRNGVSGSPRWAPSGRSIAFLRAARGQEEVWTIRPNGTAPRRVTTGVVAGEPPAWSPRGNALIVVRPVGTGSDLFRVPLTGGRGQRLTFAAARGCDVGHPSWRGNLVVYVRDCADTEQLRLLNLTTGHNRVVTSETTPRGSLSWPDFTPDMRIMFMSCGLDFPATSGCLSEDVTTIHRDGTGLAVLTNYCGCETEPGAFYPVPSPDGSRFAVMEYGTVEDQTQSFLMIFEAVDPRGLGVNAWTGPVSQRADKPDWQRFPN